MRTIIIDDEKRARLLLEAMLEAECSTTEVVGQAADLPSGVKLINKLNPDLVLLDIEMPGFNGLEIADFFKGSEMKFQIIITTAYSEFAIQSFKLNVVDYLLKPIDSAALKAAVQRAAIRQEVAKKLVQPALAPPVLQGMKRLSVPDSNGFVMVETEDLILLDADGAYTHLHLTCKRKLTATKKLRYFEDKLQGNPLFMRVHRGHIINMKHVQKFTRADGGSILLTNGFSVAVSREQIDSFLERLG